MRFDRRRPAWAQNPERVMAENVGTVDNPQSPVFVGEGECAACPSPPPPVSVMERAVERGRQIAEATALPEGAWINHPDWRDMPDNAGEGRNGNE